MEIKTLEQFFLNEYEKKEEEIIKLKDQCESLNIDRMYLSEKICKLKNKLVELHEVLTECLSIISVENEDSLSLENRWVKITTKTTNDSLNKLIEFLHDNMKDLDE